MASAVATILEPQEKIEAVFEQDAPYMGLFVLRRSALLLLAMLGASIAMTFVAPAWIGAGLGALVLLFAGIFYGAVKASARTHFYVLTSFRVINIWFVPGAHGGASFDKNRFTWIPIAQIAEASVVGIAGNVGTINLRLDDGRKDEMAGIINVQGACTQLHRAMSGTNRPVL